jgi:hypothetical protein
MEYQIALPPELGISPSEFVAAWNAEPEQRAVAEARVTPMPGAQFDPALGNEMITLVIGVLAGLATEALYDLLIQAFTRQGVRRRITIRQIEQPNGERVLIVTTDDE